MKRNLCCFLIASLLIMSWVSVASFRPFAPQQDQIPQFSQAALESKQGLESEEIVAVYENEETYRGFSRLGSRPPNCVHKCGRCFPCYAIQIPATTEHIGLQYTNYEPEGWKCKCGTSFFNP
ncbi:hypothetical protein CFOL_v3_24862 [Cephalotus follicularis]|uniref:Epidermal patterning factor-like protein n=1 Tax=Cephalotus follicularis TaxID=3775 RepID=A0A1Q3CME5_CEPFO|nr:hypothetical protein CFOL_v3_24862 [Cephalotus follicularis]